MNRNRKLFSICIPAYNRARHLASLLDSIFSQSFGDFEVVICEDQSREREKIGVIVRDYQSRYPGIIHYFENEENLGYDGNIRNLVEKASGSFCFFLGNDDIMSDGALENVASIIERHGNVGVVLKSYAWFDERPDKINQEVRYFNEETEIEAGSRAIRFAFRRSGVIAGYIVDRDAAYKVATDRFDGTLYYQMYLTANVSIEKPVVVTPKVLVLCRNGEPPEFGNSSREKGKYTPGRFTLEARLNMINGALSIVRYLKANRNVDVVEDVIHDFANYFYPYIRDQLELPIRDYYRLYRGYGKMGFSKYPLFHLYFFLGYLIGEKRFDAMTAFVRGRMGSSPRFSKV